MGSQSICPSPFAIRCRFTIRHSLFATRCRFLMVELPTAVELQVVETDPGVRGDTAAGGSKPAKLETGAVIQVPLFINVGDIVRVDTRTGRYIERVKSS
jgi:hypothetical protein